MTPRDAPGGEAVNVHAGGGKFFSLIGVNQSPQPTQQAGTDPGAFWLSPYARCLSAVFHHPADLFGHESLPDTCDVPKLALIIEGMASLLRELAAEPSPSL